MSTSSRPSSASPAGRRSTDLGLDSVGPPRGVSVQARVVATGAGTLDAYREPTGPGVRVDGCGYAGYVAAAAVRPAAGQGDRHVSRCGDVADAVDRTRRAVEELLVAGLPTNRAQLLAILARPEVRGADARTTLLGRVDPTWPTTSASPVPTTSAAARPVAVARAGACRSPPASTRRAAPMGGTIVDIRVAVGDVVRAGDGLVVVSAMKMESTVTAPCSGRVVAVADLAVGGSLVGDDVVAVIEPSDAAGPSTIEVRREDTWLPVLDDVAKLQSPRPRPPRSGLRRSRASSANATAAS